MRLLLACLLLAAASGCAQNLTVEAGSTSGSGGRSTGTSTSGMSSSSTGCAARTCAELGVQCGAASDGCTGTLHCGVCPSGQACVDARCRCVPKTCAELGLHCGSGDDGCDTMLACGDCAAPATCGGATCAGPGQPGVCGGGDCCPSTCAQLGFSCGVESDGCGTTLMCGTCPNGGVCGGPDCNGVSKPGVCGAGPCCPKTCQDLGLDCGPAGDGCGGLLQCGSCMGGTQCGYGPCGPGTGMPGVCGGGGCCPSTCQQQGIQCGPAGDGCGGVLQCGPCPQGQTCGGGGKAGTCG